MFPTTPGGSPPQGYAPLLLDTSVQSQPSIYPPPGAQSPSSPSISDLEIHFIGDTQNVLCYEICLLIHCSTVSLCPFFTPASPQWYPGFTCVRSARSNSSHSGTSYTHLYQQKKNTATTLSTVLVTHPAASATLSYELLINPTRRSELQGGRQNHQGWATKVWANQCPCWCSLGWIFRAHWRALLWFLPYIALFPHSCLYLPPVAGRSLYTVMFLLSHLAKHLCLQIIFKCKMQPQEANLMYFWHTYPLP